jgi:hypothetical protein
VLLLCPAPLRAQDEKLPAPKPHLEVWQAAYFEGLKIGHAHTVVIETKKGDKSTFRTTRTLDLMIKRYGSVVPIKAVIVNDETDRGRLLSLSVTHEIAKDKQVTLSGEVKDGALLFRSSLDENVHKLPFDNNAVGMYRQDVVFQKRKAKAGDRFKVVSYELALPAVVTLQIHVKDAEAVDRLAEEKTDKGTEIVRVPVRMLRVDAVPEKIEVGDRQIQLPTKRVWLDAKLMPVREQFDLPGLGTITLYNTTKQAAQKKGVAPELLPDVGLTTAIPVKQTIDEPYDTTRAIYRVTLTEPLDKVFSSDERQKVRKLKDGALELTVKAVREPGGDDETKPAAEYLESSQFINSKNAQVKALAKKAVGAEKDPWKKALAIQRWVHENMKVTTAAGFPTAEQIAKDLEGDCRQHALLSCALCRAAGLPARTAVGLVYVRDEGRSPHFGFHMWTEVWVRGRWLGLDAILGQVGATHLKMGDHSWAKTVTLAPFLSIAPTLGKIRIEVVSAK